MVSCVVKSCKNNSRSIKKSDGLTFHLFPRKIQNKNKWIAVIRKSRSEPEWQPNKNSVVCSDHFDDHDLYITNQGLRRVIRGGHPKKGLSESPKSDTSLASVSLSFPSVCDVTFDDAVLPIENPLNTSQKSDSSAVDIVLSITSAVYTRDVPESLNPLAGEKVLSRASSTSPPVSPVSRDLSKITDQLEAIYSTPPKADLRQEIKKQKNILQTNKKKIKILLQKTKKYKRKSKDRLIQKEEDRKILKAMDLYIYLPLDSDTYLHIL